IEIYKIAKESYNYLPDNLLNKNLYEKLEIAIAKGAKYPANENIYLALIDAMDNYLEKVSIKSIKGSVEATPEKGNAPMSVTLRGVVRDETGSSIPSYNYVWWIDEGGQRVVIGNKPSIHHVFREEGTFAAFLDVTSSHKNSKGFTDVLPFRSRADITVKEKIASLIIKVNSDKLGDKDELKFTPDESGYGLIFDATSSTPTGGAKFTRTEWDFGNGITTSNTGDPEIERVKYAKEGEYDVTLKLRTNEGKIVERNFMISVHDPIATIHATNEEGYLGDKFTFSAKPMGSDDDLRYDWQIINIDTDEEIFTKDGKAFTYSFPTKGKFNVRLKVTQPSGEIDVDTRIIYINSRAPVSTFSYSIPNNHEPNTIFLDASKSYDLDGVDDGKLIYEWIINGERVELEKARFNGATGYFTFDSVESHSVLLRVSDPEGITSQINKKVEVDSILAVDFAAYPRVTQRDTLIRFQADSPEAKVFSWDFGEGTIITGRNSTMTHVYKKSGIYNVKLQVTDVDDKINHYSKKVYIGESNAPKAHITLKNSLGNTIGSSAGQCNGEEAYIIDRAGSITFSGQESIDVTGKNTGISYSWKLGQNKYFTNNAFTQKFDELGCFPIQLTVKSIVKGTTSKINSWLKVENLKPTLSSLDVQVTDGDADPVIVKVSALGAKDPDGVIQSYLWYYYTDIDTEPQDFRATKQANTTFVLPKVTGNYYFVVLMKDNNEVRISSEEVTGSKFFITLTGDNINVPLVNLSVNDSSISVGEEVAFSTTVENILGYNLSKKAEYSWDLDGDGFYEQKTTVPNLVYTYERSGEFHAKVKAKYKGYSNTKSITMNVSNILKPSVEYISVGNKFILLNTSIGKSDSLTWDLGNGVTAQNTDVYSYEFEGNQGTHMVELELKEGIKNESDTFKLKKNVRNMLAARKIGVIAFSNHEIVNDTITLENKLDKVYLYLGESKSGTDVEITDFNIDENIEYDSNLNGGKSDDIDSALSFGQNSDVVLIKLNDTRNQTILVNAYDINDNIIDSKELLIVKEFIEEVEVDVNSIEFKGITGSEETTIERLKVEVSSLPKEYRLKSLMYVQRLQEEWFDVAEKTKIIVEFEGYISEVDSVNATEIYSLLESLLLEGEDDKSEKNLMFIALKNMTPVNIECGLSTDIEGGTCYDAIIDRLNLININIDIDENKMFGKEILQVIAAYPDMKVSDKQNYKAILSSFIYGGVDNIPAVEKEQVNQEIEEEILKEGGTTNAVIGAFKYIVWIISVIIGIFAGIFLIFFIIYKVSNKDNNVGFQDFIIEKTSGHKKNIVVQKDDTDDILKDLDTDLGEEKIKELTNKKEKIPMEKKEVEDPLGSMSEPNLAKKVETNKEEVPAWLKGNNAESIPVSKEKSEIKQKEEVKTQNNKNNSQSGGSKKSDSGDVPDWLKGSFTEEDTNKKSSASDKKDFSKQNSDKNAASEKKEVKTQEVKAEDTTKKSDIPDWLKGSLEVGEETPKKETKQPEVVKE
ncbi:PKD domain-containing protein, partial [Candidatus Gracilibacteria bacterium]|nr:PKD domain-containing protein [Candidatus Gracilibacteria bacterium]